MDKYRQDLLDLFQSDNRNTKRKRINTLTNELKELDWRIKYIEQGLNSKQRKDLLGYYCLLYGDKYRMGALLTYKAQAELIRRDWEGLISIDKQ